MGISLTTAFSPVTAFVFYQFGISTTTIPTAPPRLSFLSLPVEVRLQIYGYVLEFNPAKHAHLSPLPANPPSTPSGYFLKAMTAPFSSPKGKAEDKTEPELFYSTSISLRASSIPSTIKGIRCGYIPSSLLRTCKQVCEESRMLPWEQNEYVFINWFCSGVYGAKAFMRALKPWQREGMRWARIEVLRRDLEDTWDATILGGCPEIGEWKDLCGLWSGDVATAEGGLWGLRLGVKGRVGAYVAGEAIEGSGAVGVVVKEPGTEADHIDKLQNKQKGLLDVNAVWVTQGLSQMKALRWLEVEVEDDDVSRDSKVEFCVNLGQKLSQIGGRKISVLFVEKAVEKIKETEPQETEWGQPGDDYAWALRS